jgi:hypothetical protein
MTHDCESIEDLNNESLAHIWGGMHFRASVEHGRTLDERTAVWVVQHHLRPR